MERHGEIVSVGTRFLFDMWNITPKLKKLQKCPFCHRQDSEGWLWLPHGAQRATAGRRAASSSFSFKCQGQTREKRSG